ncbi:abscisic acid-insensitive 5-like protein 5 [Phtheirospermum japonicum]|uniref:Abscisic acid-insensitive 5-like protein 5 n=1 Tax=Phtheirospermum japonicum TaxID=374723 RepID=A0A830CXH9_9LAMI|nr:abscisic acid-insensitive 5-like protein 5 [Phtheirospermum japonicum]
MGSNLNFKIFGNDPPLAATGGSGRPPSSFSLTRQPSVYSLTFDEFQSTIGGIGKDFGSMNMDELLKSIWSAEDNQNFGSTSGGGPQGVGSLQKQGSLILPRTLSQKTVDEVWKDMSKEYGGEGEQDNGNVSGFGVPQRQPTLGEITLEEFLVRAGVVREEAQLAARANNVGFFGDLWHPVTSSNLGFGEFSNPIATQSALNLPLNVNGVRLVADNHQVQQQQQHQQQQQRQQILPKPPVLAYGNQMGIPSNGQRIRGGNGISNQAMDNYNYNNNNNNNSNNNNNNNNNNMVQNVVLQAGGLGMVGLGGNNGVGVRTGSPAVSSDGLTKSNGDTSPVSPVPYVFNGGSRGRRSAALEKVVERRQRRMIKNRESAARSRARKQAYTTELEEEVAKLKEEHEELQKKQVLEMMKQQKGGKRQCLRRTQTGP